MALSGPLRFHIRIGIFQDSGIQAPGQLSVVVPVVHTLMGDQGDGHVGGILGVAAAAVCVLSDRMDDTMDLTPVLLRFIKGGEQQDQKCHIISKTEPGKLTVPAAELTA